MPEEKQPQAWEYGVIAHVLNQWTPPTGPFDPDKAWSHTYNIYFMNYQKADIKKKLTGEQEKLPAPNAILKISSTTRAEGVELAVEYSSLMAGDTTRAIILCQEDSLLSPISWKMSFTNDLRKELVSFIKSGAVKDGILTINNKPVRGARKLETFTSDWALLAAVQRFELVKPSMPLNFDLLEYQEMPHYNQSLHDRGQAQAQCASGSVPFRQYLQFGEAIQPTHYCVDNKNRLIMAIDPRRFFILAEEKA